MRYVGSREPDIVAPGMISESELDTSSKPLLFFIKSRTSSFHYCNKYVTNLKSNVLLCQLRST